MGEAEISIPAPSSWHFCRETGQIIFFTAPLPRLFPALCPAGCDVQRQAGIRGLQAGQGAEGVKSAWDHISQEKSLLGLPHLFVFPK